MALYEDGVETPSDFGVLFIKLDFD